MKIIRHKTSGLVAFFLQDNESAEITPHGLIGAVKALGITPATHELLTGVTLSGYLPVENALAYNKQTGWSMANQLLYNSVKASLQTNQQHPIVKHITAMVIAGAQKRLDDFAQTKFYDNILSACTYATDTVPMFQQEGQYAVTKRGETWAILYGILMAAKAGQRPIPTSFEELIPELPVLEWPSIS